MSQQILTDQQRFCGCSIQSVHPMSNQAPPSNLDSHAKRTESFFASQQNVSPCSSSLCSPPSFHTLHPASNDAPIVPQSPICLSSIDIATYPAGPQSLSACQTIKAYHNNPKIGTQTPPASECLPPPPPCRITAPQLPDDSYLLTTPRIKYSKPQHFWRARSRSRNDAYISSESDRACSTRFAPYSSGASRDSSSCGSALLPFPRWLQGRQIVIPAPDFTPLRFGHIAQESSEAEGPYPEFVHSQSTALSTWMCCMRPLAAPKAAIASDAWHAAPPGFLFWQINPLCSFRAARPAIEKECQTGIVKSKHRPHLPLGIPPQRRVCFAAGMAMLLAAAMLLAFLLPFAMSPGYVQAVLRGAPPRKPSLVWIRAQTSDNVSSSLPHNILDMAYKASIKIDSISIKYNDSSLQKFSLLLSHLSPGKMALEVCPPYYYAVLFMIQQASSETSGASHRGISLCTAESLYGAFMVAD
jgi:hypothetical protein